MMYELVKDCVEQCKKEDSFAPIRRLHEKAVKENDEPLFFLSSILMAYTEIPRGVDKVCQTILEDCNPNADPICYYDDLEVLHYGITQYLKSKFPEQGEYLAFCLQGFWEDKEEAQARLVEIIKESNINPFDGIDVLFIGGKENEVGKKILPITELFSSYRNYDGKIAGNVFLDTYERIFGDKKFNIIITGNVINAAYEWDTTDPESLTQNFFCTCSNMVKKGGFVLHLSNYSQPDNIMFSTNLHKLCGVSQQPESVSDLSVFRKVQNRIVTPDLLVNPFSAKNASSKTP